MSANETEEMMRQLTSAYAGMPRQFEIEPDAVKRAVAARRRRSRSIAAVTSVAVVATVGGLAWTQFEQPDQGSQMTAAPVMIRSAGALEAYASSTARDWVKNADLVAVAKVAAEDRGAAIAAGDGTGDQFVERSVTLEVVRQLWARTDEPGLADGDTVEVTAPGLVTHADGSTSRLAFKGQPRMEVGHAYVVALIANDCTTDTVGETSWMTLGTDAVLPADGDKIGFGESEGRTVAGDVDQTTPNSLERHLLGDEPDAIAQELDAAQAGLPPGPSRGDSDC